MTSTGISSNRKIVRRWKVVDDDIEQTVTALCVILRSLTSS